MTLAAIILSISSFHVCSKQRRPCTFRPGWRVSITRRERSDTRVPEVVLL